MTDERAKPYQIEEPAPHKHKVATEILFAALLAAPAAWSLQLLVNYGLASHACFPRDTPRDAFLPGWGWTTAALAAINLTALVIALVATVASYLIWKEARDEAHGGHAHLIDAGRGRTRFFAIWGVWGGLWFVIQIIFGTIAVFGAPGCGQ